MKTVITVLTREGFNYTAEYPGSKAQNKALIDKLAPSGPWYRIGDNVIPADVIKHIKAEEKPEGTVAT